MNVVSTAQHGCSGLRVSSEPTRVSLGVAGRGCGGHSNPDPCLPPPVTSDTGALLRGQGWHRSKEGQCRDPLESPPLPPSLRSVPVDAGRRCVGRGLASSPPGLVFIGKVTRELTSGPNADPSPKVKVWELAGEVIWGGYLHLREKGFIVSIHVSTFCASSSSPSLYFRKLAL